MTWSLRWKCLMTPKDLFLQQRILIFSSRNPPPPKKLGWSSKTPTLAFNSQSPQLPASPASVLLLSSIIFIFSPGRLGPMVTCTLKLGISILNGGNVQVQQVRLHGSDIQLGLLFVLLSVSLLCFRPYIRSEATLGQRLVCTVGSLMPFSSLLSENAWLPEREKRCGLFQESLRTDAVLQVNNVSSVPQRKQELPRRLKVLVFDFHDFSSLSVLDLNAFERQNKAEGLGMVTEEGSSKWIQHFIRWDIWLSPFSLFKKHIFLPHSSVHQCCWSTCWLPSNTRSFSPHKANAEPWQLTL